MGVNMIAPTLPAMALAFPSIPNADYLSRIALTITALAIVIAAPLAGGLIDRHGRKQVLIMALLLYSLAGFSGFFLPGLYWIVVSRFVLGLAVAGIQIAVITLIGDYFAGTDRARYMGLQHVVVSLGGVVLFSMAGLLTELSWRTPFILYIAGMLLLPAVLVWIVEPQASNALPNQKLPQDWNLKGPLLVICALGFLFVCGSYVVHIYLPFLIADQGGAARFAGFGFALFMGASAASASFYSRIKNKISFSAVFIACFGLMALGLALIAVAEGLLFIVCGLVLAGLSLGLLIPNSLLWATEHAGEGLRGRSLGALTSCFYLGQFACPLLTQPIVESAGANKAIALSATLMAVTSILLAARSFFVRFGHRHSSFS